MCCQGIARPRPQPTVGDALQVLHSYFRLRGEDPTLIAPETLRYWLHAGKSVEQIYAICYRTQVES